MNNREDGKADSLQDQSITEWLQRESLRIDQISGHTNQLSDLVKQGRSWLDFLRNSVNPEMMNSLTTLFRMADAAISKRYHVSKRTLALVTGALLYFVSPIDVVPDVIPIVGLADDALVIAWTLKTIANEIREFRTWERVQTAQTVLADFPRQEVKRVVVCPGWLSTGRPYREVKASLRKIYPNATIVFFSWNANKTWDDARFAADSQECERLLDLWLKSDIPLANTVAIGHSLGARISIRAAAKLAQLNDNRNRKIEAEQILLSLVLLGGAIDCDDPDILSATTACQNPLYNFYSKSDRILGYLYQIMENKSPLGLVGLGLRQDKIDYFPFQKKKEEITLNLADKSIRETPVPNPGLEKRTDSANHNDFSDNTESKVIRGLYPNYVDIKVAGSEEFYLGMAGNIATLSVWLRAPASLSALKGMTDFEKMITDYHEHGFAKYAEFCEKCF